MTAVPLSFEPHGVQLSAHPGETILAVAHRGGLALGSACGGQGKCNACLVRVEGETSPLTAAESGYFQERQIAQGWRRACQVVAQGPCRVHVPPRSLAAARGRGKAEVTPLAQSSDPAVMVKHFELEAPSLGNLAGDADRLLAGLAERVDMGVLRVLPHFLRQHHWRGEAVVRGDEVVALLPRGHRAYGMAVDFGTTSVAAFLLDLADGSTLAGATLPNGQAPFGADVISRLGHARKSQEAAAQLAEAAARTLHLLLSELGEGVPHGEVVELVVVGNTAMHALLLGLPIVGLAAAPHVAPMAGSLDARARDLGLGWIGGAIRLSPGAQVHAAPNIAGFVGGDHVAMLLPVLDAYAGQTIAAMDIGTNTEIALVTGEGITCVSCASGPAFEAGNISWGMPAVAGAISAVSLMGSRLTLATIDDAPPAGLCGSGVLSTLAAMVRDGAIDSRGRVNEDHPRVTRSNGEIALLLADEEQTGGPPVVFTQHDVRAVQLAKAAIRAGLDILLKEKGVMPDGLDRLAIAGTFGSHIDLDDARVIGLIPPLPPERLAKVGNAAGTGARMMLASLGQRYRAAELARAARYLELAGRADFMRTFIATMSFDREIQ